MGSETLSLIRRITLVIAVPAMTLLVLGAMTSTATAAAPCHSVRVEGTKIRVAAVRTSCKAGREVASEYFERTLNGDHFDGKTGDGSIYYDVNGFRCLTGLGGSQMYCHHRNRRVYGSSRPEDHPSTWGRRASSNSASASSRRVYFVIGCSGSVYQPKEIALTCADGKVRFLADLGWEEWGPDRASTHGTLRFPACSPDVPLVTCRDYAEDEATLHLWRPIYCPTVGHWQFSRLGVEDLAGPGPEGFDRPIPYPCERFKPEPVHRLGSSAARGYMRSVLARFSYESRAGGSLKCNRRLSATRIGCEMSWVIGDTGYVGRGQIWLTFPHHEKQAHFSYRLTRVDEYCVFVTHEGHCIKKLRDTGAVSG
ncbi:MAG: hypothetical protein E6G51_06405 [Actinobacteria bacterium]|nr:MAG: hypothetical protein E6G51_06405 [Actinomycetota bacterium]